MCLFRCYVKDLYSAAYYFMLCHSESQLGTLQDYVDCFYQDVCWSLPSMKFNLQFDSFMQSIVSDCAYYQSSFI